MQSLKYLYVRFISDEVTADRWDAEDEDDDIERILEHQSYFEITYSNRKGEILVIPKANLFYWTKKYFEKY